MDISDKTNKYKIKYDILFIPVNGSVAQSHKNTDCQQKRVIIKWSRFAILGYKTDCGIFHI